jgi:phosphate starvation-inducible PhoH-like protein
VPAPSSTQVKILVPGNHLMVGLLGQRDELLRLVQDAFPVTIHVRGNEITIRGDEVEAERVGRLFEEMVALLEAGHVLDRDGVGRSIQMLKADQRPTDVLTTEVLRGRKPVRPKTAGQKRYVDAVRNHTVTFGIGPAGTGKSYLAVALAVQALQGKEINRIILTRPAVEAGERLGFLPGDILAKVDPYLRPLYDALYDMLEPEVVSRLMERGTIEVAPLAFMRGRTLNDSFIILDEAQNTTPEQMKMFLTRLGFGSKVVVTGDVTQIDLPEGRGRSGLLAVRDILDGIPDLAFVELDAHDVVRHKIVQDIVNAYSASEQSGAESREHSRASAREPGIPARNE